MHRITALILAAAILASSLPVNQSPALTCRTRYTRTGKPWCECKTDGGRWAPWPMPFCRVSR